MQTVEMLLFLASSLINLGLIYTRVPVNNLQQLISLSLALLVGSFFLSRSALGRSKTTMFFRTFLGALIIQLVVVSSGGFYSPFLILLHIFTLGAGFLLGLFPSIVFLGLSLAVLGVQLRVDPAIHNLFVEDLGSVVLYAVSFVVIVPLEYLVLQNYNLKDALTKILSKNILLGKIREESILKSLKELVVVLDQNLNVHYANNAVEAALKLPNEEIINKSVLTLLHIQDQEGTPVGKEALYLDKVFTDKATRTIANYYLTTQTFSSPVPVIIKIRPLIDPEGTVRQALLVISSAEGQSNLDFPLEQAKIKNRVIAQELKKVLAGVNLPKLQSLFEIFAKSEEDIFTKLELDEHPIQELVTLQDIAYSLKLVTDAKQNLAASLGVKLQFVLPASEREEAAYLRLKDSPLAVAAPISPFMVPVNAKWFQILADKLIDIAILLGASQQEPFVETTLETQGSEILVRVILKSPSLLAKGQEAVFVEYLNRQQEGLFTEYLSNVGSGLEGIIAQTIAKHLQLPLNYKLHQNPVSLEFSLRLSKNVQSV